MTILLLIVAIMAIIQFINNRRVWRSLNRGDWDNNDFKANCPILGNLTDQDNASHIYLLIVGYDIIIITLSIIIAFDWPENGGWIEFIIGCGLIISRITFFTPGVCAAILKYKNGHPHNPDEE